MFGRTGETNVDKKAINKGRWGSALVPPQL